MPPVRPPGHRPRGRHRPRRLRHPARRRPRRITGRPARPLPQSAACTRGTPSSPDGSPQVVAVVDASGRPGPRLAARHTRHRFPAPRLGGAAVHPAGLPCATATSRNASAAPRRCGPSPAPVRPTRSPLPSPATAWSAPTGELAGYRWGVERKRALLARERCMMLGTRISGGPRTGRASARSWTPTAAPPPGRSCRIHLCAALVVRLR